MEPLKSDDPVGALTRFVREELQRIKRALSDRQIDHTVWGDLMEAEHRLNEVLKALRPSESVSRLYLRKES